MNILGFIDRSDFYQGVSLENKKLLSDICIPKNLAKKEVLFYEGDQGNSFFFLASGAVGLYKGAENGKEIVIKIIQPGEPFAEVILFEHDIFPVTAIAIKPCIVFGIPKSQFKKLLSIENFRNDFISMLMRKQRYLAERIRFLTMYDVEERFFIFLKEHFGTKDRIAFNLSKKDIAAAIGTTPENYSRLISRLAAEEKIKFEGKVIEILSGQKGKKGL